jgi:hypothetical protein
MPQEGLEPRERVGLVPAGNPLRMIKARARQQIAQ